MIKIIQKISALIMNTEKHILMLLAFAVTGLILLNVVTRSANYALYWVDELAIYTMIWMIMIGASLIIRLRKGIAVTIVDEFLSPRHRQHLSVVVDVSIFCIAAIFLWLNFIWYDPLTLISVGFDLEAFSQENFNFIYEEPTNTLGVKKFWLWMVMPLTALTMSIHALANLLENALRLPRTVPEMM
jgi:TRAP-type C4-dicarboxylate transport system permease small subunit